MSKLKIIPNQSNSNNICPNDVCSLGFLKKNFDILSNKSKKAYSFECEDKCYIIDKFFCNNSEIFYDSLIYH